MKKTKKKRDNRRQILLVGAVVLLVLAVGSYVPGVWQGSWERHGLRKLEKLEPEPEPGDNLRIASFWTVPKEPKAGDTVTYKLTGVGVTRAELQLSVYDPFTGTTTATHDLPTNNGVWWYRETYDRPCSILATPRVYGGGESLEGNSLSITVVLGEQPAPVEETVMRAVEQVSETVESFLARWFGWWWPR